MSSPFIMFPGVCSIRSRSFNRKGEPGLLAEPPMCSC
jgi:hypothetical protein